MIYTKKTTKYFKDIVSLKNPKGYVCKECSGNEFYERKNPPTTICKNCGYEESITANTAFHNQKIPISKAMDILFAIQENYKRFGAHIGLSPFTDYEYDIETRDLVEDYYRARLSLQKISKKFKIQKKSAEAFIKRIGKWLPIKYSKKCEAEQEWLSGLKNENSKRIYTSLFNLLFDDDEPRSKEAILYTLVKKRIKSESYFE